MANPHIPALNKSGLKDLSGRTFGYLKVLFRVVTPAGQKQRWRCQCECGARLTVRHDYLIHTNSPKTHCGCKNKGLGTLYSGEYHIWKMMLQRCYNPGHVSYKEYGGRGIKVCDEWRESFEAFFKYLGARPTKTHSLDRKDPNGNYAPGNVKWSTKKEQARNKRNSVYLIHPLTGIKVPAAVVAEHFGITYQQLRHKYLREGKWPTNRTTSKSQSHPTSSSSTTACAVSSPCPEADKNSESVKLKE